MTNNGRQPKRDLIAFVPVLVAVTFSILAIWFFGFGKMVFGDANDYIAGARAFLNHTPYPHQSELHPMFRPPLFPLFIAMIWKVFPDSIVAVKFGQAILHGGTCWVIYRIVFEVLGKRIPAFLGAMVCAINPLLVAHTVDFFTEPLHTFMFALGILFAARFLKNGDRAFVNAAIAGVVFGLATLCRPSALGIVLSTLPVIVLLKLRDPRRLRWIAACGVFFVFIFGAIAPWTYYNYKTTGEFILVNDGFSYNLWLGNHPATIRIYENDFKDVEDNQRFADYIWGDMIKDKVKELERTDNYSSLKFNQREKVWRREAIKNYEQDPVKARTIFLGKARTYWTPFLNTLVYGWKKVAIVATFVIGVFVFGVYGAVVFCRTTNGREVVVVLACIFVVATLIHMLIAGLVRYRVPYVDPYLSMLAGVGVWDLGRRFFMSGSVAE